MSKEMGVVALGVWVVVMPYLGIYRSWLTILMVLTGTALMIVGFLLRGEAITREHQQQHVQEKPRRKSRVTFQESAPVVSHDYTGETPQSSQ